MRDIHEMCRLIEEEIGNIAEKRLNTGNLDTAYKLIDMLKDIKNMEYWERKGEYYDLVSSEMRGGHSERRRYSRSDGRMHNDQSYNGGSYGNGSSYARRGEHYVRGHYSRSEGPDTYDEYMTEKKSYRSGSKTEDCKRRMLEALEGYMDDLTEELGTISRDADCAEERDMILRYLEKLRKMM